MRIPDGFYLSIHTPDGNEIDEVSLDEYDSDSTYDAVRVGDTVLETVGRFLERGDT